MISCEAENFSFMHHYVVVVLTRGTNFLDSDLGLPADWDQFIAHSPLLAYRRYCSPDL
jgi:hypothetical protein